MILGIGIDLMETDRMARALERQGERLARRVFTDHERADCSGRVDEIQRLAARFAVKEACLKALGTGWAEGLAFRQVEVRHAPSGAPELLLSGAAEARAASLGVRRRHVSLTHQPGAVAAIVILED